MIVTAVVKQPRRKRVNLYLDGEFVLSLHAGLAAQRDIRPGRELRQPDLEDLADADAQVSAFEAALRLLAYRPRSEQELRLRLARRGFRGAAIGGTVRRLRELGYVNDEAFAHLYVETQQAGRPRSRRLLAAELRRRGIAQGTAEGAATAGASDEEAAYQAASRRLRVLRGLAYRPFREKLGAFLTRRGFSYEVARRTIERCWEELEEERGRTEAD
jgi:regulatory protein